MATWNPDDKTLLAMRRMSREGYTAQEIHADIKPPIGIESFRATLKRFFIYPKAANRAHAGTSGLKVSPGGRK